MDLRRCQGSQRFPTLTRRFYRIHAWDMHDQAVISYQREGHSRQRGIVETEVSARGNAAIIIGAE